MKRKFRRTDKIWGWE